MWDQSDFHGMKPGLSPSNSCWPHELPLTFLLLALVSNKNLRSPSPPFLDKSSLSCLAWNISDISWLKPYSNQSEFNFLDKKIVLLIKLVSILSQLSDPHIMRLRVFWPTLDEMLVHHLLPLTCCQGSLRVWNKPKFIHLFIHLCVIFRKAGPVQLETCFNWTSLYKLLHGQTTTLRAAFQTLCKKRMGS